MADTRKLSALFILVATLGVTSGAGRARICSRGDRCIWLNELLLRRGAFPLQGDVGHNAPIFYCYEGVDRYTLSALEKAWSGVGITLSNSKNVIINVGNSSQSVLSTMSAGHDLDKDKYSLVLSPYDDKCVGLVAREQVDGTTSYTLNAQSRVVLHLPVLMGLGLTLCFTAHSLSRSLSLYYGGGITVGVLASVLILLYIFSRFVPKKNVIGFGIFAGGWALFGTAVYWFLDHLLDTAIVYWQYLAVYVVIAAVVSFAVLYRMGPISNPRTFDLIQWSIQAIGLCLVYFSTQMWELSLCVCVTAVLFYILPSRYNPVLLPFIVLLRLLYCVFYPLIVCLKCFSFLNPFSWFRSIPQRRLLTAEEYEEEGRVETEKALNELRQHCQDLPTREVVGLMSKLNDTKRFAGFLGGKNHVSQEEQEYHDWAFADEESSDDEDEYNDSQQSTPLSSSMDSPRHSFSDSPIRRGHPSPSRSPGVGQRSPYRIPTASRLQHRSPTKPRTYYHTTY